MPQRKGVSREATEPSMLVVRRHGEKKPQVKRQISFDVTEKFKEDWDAYLESQGKATQNGALRYLMDLAMKTNIALPKES